ncbi:MAG: N4-gp56 family major capsid protein [Candidatus Faecousia sp.]|nr:N4-gp56 family major capsid protein [Candidatus Faecousia sp.]
MEIIRNLILMGSLQLFAGTLNTNVTTDSGLSAENKTFYDRTLLESAKPNLIHSQFGQKRPIPKNGGKKIEFRRYGALPKALTPLTEGVTPDGRKLTVTSIEAEVHQYGDYVALSDVLDLTAIDNNVLEATKAIGNQAGLTLDTITRNILQAGTNVQYCPKVGASGTTAVTSRADIDATCKLTVDEIKKAVATLKANNVPKISGSYVAIIHPYAAYDLMSDPNWEEMHKYTSAENMYEGEIGRIAGVRFVESSEALIVKTSTNPAVFCTLVLGENAYGITEVTGGGLKTIIKQLGSAGTADPLDQRSTVGWKAMQTAEILQQNYMIRIESGGAFSGTAKAN